MLKVMVTKVEEEWQYGGAICGPAYNRCIEITGRLVYPFTYQEAASLVRERVILVPQDQKDTARDRLWCEALVEVLGENTKTMEAVLAAFNKRSPV